MCHHTERVPDIFSCDFTAKLWSVPWLSYSWLYLRPISGPYLAVAVAIFSERPIAEPLTCVALGAYSTDAEHHAIVMRLVAPLRVGSRLITNQCSRIQTRSVWPIPSAITTLLVMKQCYQLHGMTSGIINPTERGSRQRNTLPRL